MNCLGNVSGGIYVRGGDPIQMQCNSYITADEATDNCVRHLHNELSQWLRDRLQHVAVAHRHAVIHVET